MNARLGDDAVRGWLLLGSVGRAQNVGGVAAPDTGGAGSSTPGMGHASALAQQLAGGAGGGGGRAGGGSGTGSRRSLP